MRHKFILFIWIYFFFAQTGISQNSQKIIFDQKDSLEGYYLAIPPISGKIAAVQVLLLSFNQPEIIIPETKLPNLAYGNDILTVIASLRTSLFADGETIERISKILNHVSSMFSAGSDKFVLGGMEYAGNIALRYTELCYENPSQYPVRPRAVFAINCPVDLIGLAHLCERQIKKNFYPGLVGDGNYILNAFTKQIGTLADSSQKYIRLSPFYRDEQKAGNEQYLKNIPVRLYYDIDIEWQLKNRRNSFYDTYIPDGSELINRLLLSGNEEAEFITAKLPAFRSNGLRNPDSWSVVDETEYIRWIKEKLDIFDPNTYKPVYALPFPKDWGIERFSFPIDFAPEIPYKGIEDVRFAPGWGDKNSQTYWSYCYLWWLEGSPDIDPGRLGRYMEAYYSGLVKRNIVRRNIPSGKLVPTIAKLEKIKTESGDTETYRGTIDMLDYMEQKPIKLFMLVHIKNCITKNRTAVFFAVSPKPAADPVWDSMHTILDGFQCSK
jgi:hypothetical protein